MLVVSLAISPHNRRTVLLKGSIQRGKKRTLIKDEWSLVQGIRVQEEI